MQNRDTLYEE